MEVPNLWQIKGIDKITKNEKVFKSWFKDKEKSDNYLNTHYKNVESIWVEEKDRKPSENMNLEENINNWIWLYSIKKNEFFPYGVLKGFGKVFVKIQTKEENLNINEFVDIRIERIKNMIDTEQLLFKDEGYFVNLKKYM